MKTKKISLTFSCFVITIVLFLIITSSCNVDTYAKAYTLYNKGDYKSASLILASVVKKQKDNIRALRYLASSYAFLQEDKEAIKVYHQLIEIAKIKNVNFGGTVYFSLGMLYAKEKKYQEALTFLLKGLKEAEDKFKDSIALYRIKAKYYHRLYQIYSILNLTDEASKVKKLAKENMNRYKIEKIKIDAQCAIINKNTRKK